MRLLFLTNFYPPASMGGYEQWCQEVAEGLRQKGHDVVVLTSNYLQSQYIAKDPEWIRRELFLEMELKAFSNVKRFFFERKRNEEDNLQILSRLLASFSPDGIAVWGMWNLNRSLLQVLERELPGRVVYYMGDYWPFLPSQYEFYWQAPAKSRLASLPKRVLGTIARKTLKREGQYQARFEHVLFPSLFMQREFSARGIHPANSRIIFGAVNTKGFNGLEKPFAGRGVLSLLFAGRLEHEKGVHTAVESAGILVEKYQYTNFRLIIIGSGDRAYENSLHKMVRDKKLEAYVSFQGSQPKEMMPALYSQADVFLFTSIWQEPFGRVLVEAMASGLVVIGTATGGSAEILIDGQTGLSYPSGDAEALASQIFKLSSNPDLYRALSEQGRMFAVEKFSSERMVDEIEEYFVQLVVQ